MWSNKMLNKTTNEMQIRRLEQGTRREQKAPFGIVISLNAGHFVMVNTINKQQRINIFLGFSRGRSEFLHSNSVASLSPISLLNNSKLFCINNGPAYPQLAWVGQPIIPPPARYNPRLNYHNCPLFLPATTTSVPAIWAEGVHFWEFRFGTEYARCPWWECSDHAKTWSPCLVTEPLRTLWLQAASSDHWGSAWIAPGSRNVFIYHI